MKEILWDATTNDSESGRGSISSNWRIWSKATCKACKRYEEETESVGF